MTDGRPRRTSGDERAHLLGDVSGKTGADEENRIPKAGVGGYREDTDDSVKKSKSEIRQAPMVMVPRGTAGAAAGAGGMMMPPMMGMGRGMGTESAASAASGLVTRGNNMSVSGGAFGSVPGSAGLQGSTMAAGSTPDFGGSYYGGAGTSDPADIAVSDKTTGDDDKTTATTGGAAAMKGDIQVGADSLERATRQWQDFGDELDEILDVVSARSGDVGFGKVIQPKPAYEELAATAKTSIAQVTDGFGRSSQQLYSTLGAYRATEEDNVHKIKGIVR